MQRFQVAFVLVALGCSSGGLPSRDAGPRRTRPADAGPTALGRAGPVTLDLDALVEAVVEARVLALWRTGRTPPANALDDVRVRRRVLTKALETRLVRREAERRGLVPQAEELEGLLRAAALGRGPQPLAGAPLPDLEARVVARFGAPLDRVARVARDLVEARLLAEALLDAAGEDAPRSRWLDENTRVRLDIVSVSRVPSPAEIDRALKERGPAIDAWYTANEGRFRKPERVLVSRLFVPDRGEAEALRGRAAAGEDFSELARAHSKGPNARRGGRVGAVKRTQVPSAFDVEPGGLTPVHPEPGGYAFYRVERRVPASARERSDPGVRREIAATLLRAAQRARDLLREAPEGPALAAHLKAARARRRTTDWFNRGAHDVVPTVGLAPELFAAAFAAGTTVTPVFTVRQSYVCARVLERQDADPGAWPAAREAFVEEWRRRERPVVIETWLSGHLKGRPTWVDMDGLERLKTAELVAPGP